MRVPRSEAEPQANARERFVQNIFPDFCKDYIVLGYGFPLTPSERNSERKIARVTQQGAKAYWVFFCPGCCPLSLSGLIMLVH